MGLKVSFSDTTKALTIKTGAPPTKISALTDVDVTGVSATEDGATLIYDKETQTYKSVKIFEELENDYELNGGTF